MEYSVKLARLPSGIAFPERLRDRVSFDPAHGLSYRGFMTKCTYDELSALSDDPEYHRALEQLFVLTSSEMSPPTASRNWPAVIMVATIGVAALALAVVWAMVRPAPAGNPAAPQDGVVVTSTGT